VTPLEQRRFELHAQTDEYQRRIQQARDRIQATVDRYGTPYVAVSGGKDSTVVYHLAVMGCGLHDLDVFHFDWGLRNIPGINEHVRDLVDEYGGTLIQRTSEGVTDEETFAEDEHKGMAGIMGWVARLKNERGWDVGMLGIRAEESAKRRDDYTGEPPARHNMGPVPVTAPIHGLTTGDVWAYIVEHGLPYPDHYDDRGELFDGIDARENRLVTMYDHQFDDRGSEALSQFHYPGDTNELKRIEHEHADPHNGDNTDA